MSYITMKTDIQNALTQINTSFGASLTDEYNDDFKLPYAAYIIASPVEALKQDSFMKNYYPQARQRLSIIREIEGITETEAVQELMEIVIELQDRLIDKYMIDSEYITPIQSFHNRNKPCYESTLILTKRK